VRNGLSQPGQLWLYRCKPQDDELFSSWLVRLAWGLAVKLQYLCVRVLRERPGFLASDLDRAPGLDVLSRLVDGTGVSPERARMTGLSAYEGVLWAQYVERGPLPWVLPIGRLGRRRIGHGLQYCSACLQEDRVPYFRRHWRLAFSVVCVKHGIPLRDACPFCGEAIQFHVQDFGLRLLPFECMITYCASCGKDLRDAPRMTDELVSESLLRLQEFLMNALAEGYSSRLPGGNVYSFSHFEGFRYLMRTLASAGRGARLREYLLQGSGPLSSGNGQRQVIEHLRHADRLVLMDLCAKLLVEWPHAFVHACKASKVSSSYIIRYDASVPYWLYRELRWELADQDYAASPEEREAVRAYLASQGLPVNDFATDVLLGRCRRPRSCTRESEEPPMRWNPRGARDRIRRS